MARHAGRHVERTSLLIIGLQQQAFRMLNIDKTAEVDAQLQTLSHIETAQITRDVVPVCLYTVGNK